MFKKSCALLTASLIATTQSMASAADSTSVNSDAKNAPVDIYSLSLAELGQVQVSIASGNGTPLDKAPGTASVIYAAQIEAMGARTLDDVLETVPGLHVSLSSLSRLDSVYSIRGIHTGFNAQVLLLINGSPVQSTLQGGHPTMFRMPANSIARVEVMRGPGSAVYGADAYAGVINVITKDAADFQGTQIDVSTGSFGQKELSLQSATTKSGVGISLDMTYQETDGDSSRRVSSDFQSALDKSLHTSATLAPNALSTRYHVLDSRLSLSADKWQINFWDWISRDAGVGAGAAQALDPTGRDDNHLMMADAIYRFKEDSSGWDLSAKLSHLYSDHATQFNLLPAGTKVPIGSDGNINFTKPAGLVTFPEGLKGNPGQQTNDSQIEFISVYNGFYAHRLRVSIGERYQTFDGNESKNFGPGVIDGKTPVIGGAVTEVTDTPYIYLADGSRTIRFLSLQDEWQLMATLALTAGVRYDDFSDFGNVNNPRVALVWGAAEGLTTKLLYGSAFRAPSITEYRQQNNPVSLGNPNIKPETIDTTEWSTNYRINRDLQAVLSVYKYNAKGMIDFVADSNGLTKTAQNVRNQDGSGYEVEVNWKASTQLHLGTSYSKENATDANTGAPVPDAPASQIKFNADWEFTHNWFLNAQVYRVADRHRLLTDKRAPIADYTWVNTTLRAKDIYPNVDLLFSIRNATDTNAREPSSGRIAEDYPLESRSGWLELKFSFQ